MFINEAKALIKPSMYGNLTQLDTSSAFIIVATDLDKFDKGVNFLIKLIN